MTETNDKWDGLIAKAAAGDRAAMEDLLDRVHDPLLAHLRRTVTGKAATWVTPEDVLQETLFEACRRIPTLDHRGHEAFFAWLKKVAQNKLLNLIEAREADKRGGGKSHVKPGGDETATRVLEMLRGQDPTPSRILQRKEALGATERAMALLPSDKRKLIELRFGQGLSIQEVASHVGKNEGAIKMAIKRALEDLHTLIQRDGEFTAGL